MEAISIIKYLEENYYSKGIKPKGKELEAIKRTEENKDNYKKIRKVLFNLQKQSGAIIKPIAFAQLFYVYLRKYYPSRNNLDQARNMAEVFAILCNEYYIHGKMHGITTAFFITEEKWREYMIGKTAKEHSIKILKKMKLIDYYNFYKESKQHRRRMYIINLEKLEELIHKTSLLKEKIERKEIKF